MCSHTGRGRLEKRIFGNSVLPKHRPDEILPGIALMFGIGFRREPPIGRTETSARGSLSLHSALRKDDEGAAHGEVLFFGNAFDLNRQLCRNGDALADG